MAKSLIISRALSASFLRANTNLHFNSSRVRTLYTKEAMGIEGYIQTRQRVATQFVNMTDKFKTKMTDFVEPKAANMIFTEDLKNMVHLAENNESDIKLVTDMIIRFNKQNTSLRFGNFIFGPVVMRMFYFLNKPDEALELFKNPDLEGFFDQLITYQLLMDLLFKNDKLEKVIEVFEIIKAKQIQNAKYPKHAVVLVLAALYKQNTKDSYQYAVNLWSDFQKVGHQPMRKASTFMAALALNQGAPQVALEVLSGLQNQSYMTVRNIKLAALTSIGRLDDAVQVLKSVLNVDVPNQPKFTFNPEVLERLNSEIEKSGNKELITDYQRIAAELKNGHIADNSLDFDLCRDVFPNTNQRYGENDGRFSRDNSYRNYNQQSNENRPFRNFRQDGFRSRNQYQRPGLTDLQ